MDTTQELTVLNLDLTARPHIPDDAALLAQTITALQVIDEPSFEVASKIMTTCTGRANTIEEFFKASKEAAHRAHKTLTETISKMSSPYASTALLAKTKMAAFRRAQDLESRAANLKAEQEADTERRRLEAESLAAKRAGEMAQAKELQAKAQDVIAEVVPVAKIQVTGVQERRPWKVEPTGPDAVMELIKAIAAGEFPLNVQIVVQGRIETRPILNVDTSVLNYLAKTQGADMRVPGHRSFEDFQFASTRK